MNETVKKIADAVLYEGFILYPYRASAVKNRRRFNFGVFVPKSYAEAQNGTENWRMRTEILVAGDRWKVELKLRFLHLRKRQIFRFAEDSRKFEAVEQLEIDGRVLQTWQESSERETDLSMGLSAEENVFDFDFGSTEETELINDSKGETVGKISRKHSGIAGKIRIRSERITSKSISRLTVIVENETPFENAAIRSRDEALAGSLVSAHLILSVSGGEFVSLLEPPEEFAEAAANCRNINNFPVLVGEKDKRDCVLASPIILYDYPEIAAESVGDLYDGAEIDELLTLRILTMTDAEKTEMATLDDTARALLERTESLSEKQLSKMHGAFRETK